MKKIPYGKDKLNNYFLLELKYLKSDSSELVCKLTIDEAEKQILSYQKDKIIEKIPNFHKYIVIFKYNKCIHLEEIQ